MKEFFKRFFLAVLFFLCLGLFAREEVSAKAPVKSYAIRSSSDSDRVFCTNGKSFYQDDWAGSDGQYFRFEKCRIGSVNGYRILSTATGLAMTVRSARNGAEVVFVSRRTDIRQVWYVQYMKNGSVEFLSAVDKRYALSVKGASKEPGAPLVVFRNTHRRAQQWLLSPGTITSAKIGSNRRTVTVKASFTRVMPSDEGRIYLVAVEPYRSLPSGGRIVGSVNASLSVTIKADLGDGTEACILQKKLMLMRKYKGYYFPISNGYYITNPEKAAANQKAFPAAVTKKGLKIVLGDAGTALAERLNASHVLVDFPLEAFLNGVGYSYVYEGKAYQFSTAIYGYVSYLKSMRATGAVITGVFYLHDKTLTDCIYPDAVNGSYYNSAHVFALNTENEGRKRLEALFSCLAEAFTQDDILVANWIYGNEVDQYNVYHYAGEIPYSIYHEALADGFRMFNTAVKSKWKNARTYLSLDHNWNLSWNANGTYRGIQLTADFNKDLAGEGAVHWDMAMHPYPSPEMDCRFWKISSYVTNSGVSQQITMANASAFAKYIKSTYGQNVHIILSETGLCAVDGSGTERLADQAASVALAYYLTEFDPNIDMIGIHREMDENGSEWYLGLYEYDGYVFSASSARPSARVFKYMDTPLWEEKVGRYARRISYEDWPQVIESYGLTFSESALING